MPDQPLLVSFDKVILLCSGNTLVTSYQDLDKYISQVSLLYKTSEMEQLKEIKVVFRLIVSEISWINFHDYPVSFVCVCGKAEDHDERVQ